MCHPPVIQATSRPAESGPWLSFLVVGRGREALARTARGLYGCGLASEEYEILALDDAPPGRTGEAKVRRESGQDVVAKHFPLIHLMAQAEPGRSTVPTVRRDQLFTVCRGEVLVTLEAGCAPRPGSLARLRDSFRDHPRLGAAPFLIHGPEGAREGADLPGLVHFAATAFRRLALEKVGGLVGGSSRRAEEFELSLRLLATGWEVRGFDDLHVTRMRDGSRAERRRAVARDAADSLALPWRYFPRAHAAAFARGWLRHSRWLAEAHGCRWAYRAGALAGRVRALRRGHRRPVSDDIFERLTQLEETERRLRRAQDRYRLSKILLVDLGKATPVFWLAARRCEIEIVAVADERLGGSHSRSSGASSSGVLSSGVLSAALPSGGWYQNVPVLADELAAELDYDAAVIGDLCPPSAAARRDAWRLFSTRPVIDLYEDDSLAIRPYAPRFRLRRPSRAGHPFEELMEAQRRYREAESAVAGGREVGDGSGGEVVEKLSEMLGTAWAGVDTPFETLAGEAGETATGTRED